MDTQLIDIGASLKTDYDVTGGGLNVWDNNDTFTFRYVKQTGDFVAVVKVNNTQQPSGVDALVGLMVRDSLDSNAANAYARSTGTTGASFKLGYRLNVGGTTASIGNIDKNAPGYWLRLTRKTVNVLAEYSLDGTNWKKISNSVAPAISNECYVGMAVCSRNASKTATVSFSNFKITAGVPTDPTPPTSPVPPPVITKPNTTNTVNVTNPVTQSYASNTRYVLPAGVTKISTIGIGITGHDIIIEGAPVDSKGAPTSWLANDQTPFDVPATATKPAVPANMFAAVYYVQATGNAVHFKNIGFVGTPVVEGAYAKNPFASIKMAKGSQNITIENCPVVDCQLWFGRGYTGLEVIDCPAPVVPEYWGVPDNSGGEINKNTVIRNAHLDGSILGHDLRTWGVDGMWIIGGTIRNPDSIPRPAGAVHGEALNLLDVVNVYVDGVSIEGPCRAGPIISPYHPEHRALNVYFQGCTFKDTRFYLESALTGFHLTNCSGSLRVTVKSSFNGRPIATGTMTNVDATGPSTSGFASVEAPFPLSHFFTLNNVKYNGQQVS